MLVMKVLYYYLYYLLSMNVAARYGHFDMHDIYVWDPTLSGKPRNAQLNIKLVLLTCLLTISTVVLLQLYYLRFM